ncbi:hypothetical protein V6V47_26375 [Micromonospora sp. CPCC 205539]|uniref:hypothetical protein n=1 Tax=Micromonospora sp. CPCC 205539 TaxID=3122408 RepID=UPI002FF3E0FA
MASTLGCGATLGLTAAPAAAAVSAPTNLQNADLPCAAAAPGPYLSPDRLNDARAVVLKGTYSGTGQSAELQADFQVWDVTDPEHPQQWRDGVNEETNEVYIQLEDDSRQLDGVTYAWRVRVLDGTDASPWSSTCHFTIDRSGGTVPTVASTEYPAGSWGEAHGAIGTPGVFRFTSTNDDTVKYRYRFDSSELTDDDEQPESFVDAQGLGGAATVPYTPRAAGAHYLSVYAIDRAGNYSPWAVNYEFHVSETRPSIWSAAYPNGSVNLDYNVGVPGAFEFTANVADAASFVWRIDGGGPSGTVPADSAGKATAMIAPTRAGRQTLYVHSVTRDGTAHAPRAYQFLVDNGPLITGDTDRGVTIGSSLTFHLAPRSPRVTAYLYWLVHHSSTGEPPEKITVPARADGTADLTWTATDSSVLGLNIQSRSADGTLSEPRWNYASVDGASPMVNVTGGTDFGTPATLTARSLMENIVDYVATFNGDATTRQVLKPAADGGVTFSYTAKKSGYNYVKVVARNAAGVQSDEGGMSWSVTDAPRVTSTDFPSSGSGRLATGTFSFTPRLPGTTRYEYSINYGSVVSIAARPDGTATLSWTPPDAGQHLLTVRSVTAGGIRSSETQYYFTIEAATVSSVAPAVVAPGAIRTITIEGTRLDPRDTVQVTPATGQPLAATVKSVSADGTTMTAEVNLATAPAGPASLSLRPYGASQPVVVDDAFTINPPLALRTATAPTITGRVAVGGTVRAKPGEWTPTATAYRYQWSANGVAITGATAATLRVTPGLLGKRLTVAVTASRAGFTSTTVTSAATAAVAEGPTPPRPTTTGPTVPWLEPRSRQR